MGLGSRSRHVHVAACAGVVSKLHCIQWSSTQSVEPSANHSEGVHFVLNSLLGSLDCND